MVRVFQKLVLASLVSVVCVLSLQAQENSQLTAGNNQIKQMTEQFVTAFNNGDAKSIAARFAEAGEMIVDGESIAGRGEIESRYAQFFAQNPGLKISVHIDSIRMHGPNAATETGVSEVMNDDDESIVDSYSNVYALTREGWQLIRSEVSQSSVDEDTNWKQEINVLLGKWRASKGDWSVETTIQWLDNGNFLKREYVVMQSGKKVADGTHIIGWDAATGQVRSWMFPGEGGHGQGAWSREGNQLVVECTSTGPNGESGLATNVYTLIGNDQIRWQSINRSLNGVELDDTDSVIINRVK